MQAAPLCRSLALGGMASLLAVAAAAWHAERNRLVLFAALTPPQLVVLAGVVAIAALQLWLQARSARSGALG